jgi:hypothetical protein
MECFVYNWRILLGGAVSAAILAVGVAAPAFAQAQDAPVSLSGLNSASGVLCGVSLPVSGEISAAANVIGASCGTSSASSSSSTTSNGIQTNGPMQAGSPASALPGLNSVTGSIPALGNAANAAPGVANTAGTVDGSSTSSATPAFGDESGSSTTNNTSSGSSTGLGSVTGTLSGVTGSLQNGSLNGGAISTPLSGQNG